MDYNIIKWRCNDAGENYDKMICCQYGGNVLITPRLSVCSDYHVPCTLKQAEAFVKYYLKLDMDVDLSDNSVFDTHIESIKYARKIQSMLTEMLYKPYNRGKFRLLMGSNGYDIYVNEISKFNIR